jgi:hypothetical protein
VERLLRDPDADIRYFALLVFCRAGPENLPEHAAPLVGDADPGVSNIAILAMRAHRGLLSRKRAMAALYGSLNEADPPIVALLRTFGVLRDPGCVPHIAALLQHPDPSVVQSTERVLQAITARDLGPEAGALALLVQAPREAHARGVAARGGAQPARERAHARGRGAQAAHR